MIRVRAGIRGGLGAGVFRDITVEGSYTIGSEEADPTFSISGEMFIRQKVLTDQLPTDPAVYPAAGDRFVRGHLLNYNLGGPGKDFNLYPITVQANVDHVNFIEGSVKDWVNEDKLWVRYEVKVLSSGALVPLKGGLNAVESVLEAKAEILDANLSPALIKSVRIASRYDSKKFKKGGDSGLDEMDTASSTTQDVNPAAVAALSPRAIDVPVVPLVLNTSAPLSFSPGMYADLLITRRGKGPNQGEADDVFWLWRCLARCALQGL